MKDATARHQPPPIPRATAPELSPEESPVVAVERRRAHERLDLEVEVDVASDHNFYTGFSTNISEGGIFVATHVTKPIGAMLEVTFRLPGDDTPIVALADVRWVRTHNEHSDTPPGLGLRFARIDEDSLRRIAAFVEARAPLFHEE